MSFSRHRHLFVEFGLFLRAFGINTPTGKPVGQTDVLFMRGARSEKNKVKV